MEGITIYIGSLAAAVVLCEMLLSLLPEGSMQKFVKMVVGILLLILIMSPLKNCDFSDVTIPEVFAEQEAENAQNNYEEIIMDVYNRALENKNK